MNIIFMGTPAFALPSLEALVASHDVRAVYSRPDAVSGRGKKLVPSPVKARAMELGIPVHTPRSFYAYGPDGLPLLGQHNNRVLDAAQLATLESCAPDLIVVAACDMLLPSAVLELPTYGSINVHGSLLPRWRGAAPIQRAILAGDEQLGVCIMRMESGLDTGPWCASTATSAAGKHLPELVAELGALGATLLIQSIPDIAATTAVWTSQDPILVTFANKVEKSELLLAPTLTADECVRRVRASSPSTPARCRICDRTVTILRAAPAPGISVGAPGSAGCVDKRMCLQAADGAFEVIEVKPEGKNAMPAIACASGMPAMQSGCGPKSRWEAL